VDQLDLSDGPVVHSVPTALIGEYHGNPLAVALFGGVFALNTALFIVLQTYIVRRLLKPELADAQDPNLFAKSLIGIVFYLAGAALAWVSITAAFMIYMITPWFFITPPQYRSASAVNGQRRFPREGAGD
jgi:uncharacterized membrane protein